MWEVLNCKKYCEIFAESSVDCVTSGGVAFESGIFPLFKKTLVILGKGYDATAHVYAKASEGCRKKATRKHT